MDVNKTSFKILFAGDYHSYGDYNKFICKNPKHDTFSDKNLKEIISSCDLRVFNLENPLTKEKNLANGFLILKLEDIKEEKIKVDLKDELNKAIMYETDKQLNIFSKIYFDTIKINTNLNEL